MNDEPPRARYLLELAGLEVNDAEAAELEAAYSSFRTMVDGLSQVTMTPEEDMQCVFLVEDVLSSEGSS